MTRPIKNDLYVVGLANALGVGKDISGLPNVVVYNDSNGISSNTKNLYYTSGSLSQIIQTFTYGAQVWTVTTDYNLVDGIISNMDIQKA
jgi:hypothetical protein